MGSDATGSEDQPEIVLGNPETGSNVVSDQESSAEVSDNTPITTGSQKNIGKAVQKPKKKNQKIMTMNDYVEFARRLMQIGSPRNKSTTGEKLNEIFTAYKTVG